jgi:hypothetical protein
MLADLAVLALILGWGLIFAGFVWLAGRLAR